MDKAEIFQRIKEVPKKPGVYIYEDAEGNVLYVGKARSLKQRMSSYFQKSANPLPKLKALVGKTADFRIYVVENELEALVLECNLIKKYRPPFNVLFRDDKSYPFIAVTVSDEYPRVLITREHHKKGTRYFGPYTNIPAVRETFDTLRRIFPFRTCKQKAPGRSSNGPCLNYHIKRCLGPCADTVSKEEYRAMIKEVCDFLEGRADDVVKHLSREMQEAAGTLEFEKAARLRNRLEAAQLVLQRQRIVSDSQEDMDVIGMLEDESSACANLTMVRDGKLLGSESFVLNRGVSDDEVLGAFVKQYYASAVSVPGLILVPGKVEDRDVIEEWLTAKRGARVEVRQPKRGTKRGVLGLAETNARHYFEMYKTRKKAQEGMAERAALGLAEALGLTIPPRRIECFDISTIQGDSPVGSMVVFFDGQPKNQDYRRFKIRAVDGQNDFGMMREILERRLKALVEGSEDSFRERPDLIVVDGGRPQLTAAMTASADVGIGDIPIVALAKREEELFLPGSDVPVRLADDCESLNLIKRVRDEAHRFAVSYHRKLRASSMIASGLDGIAGVAEKRKRLLVGHFGSPGRVAEASLEELLSVPGLPALVATRVYRHYHDTR
ncbi:MAG: excinuclease ABC subunit UvrC [Candidatus Aquicultorales bacterium]